MLAQLRAQLRAEIEKSLKDAFPQPDSFPVFDIEMPSDKAHGDLSCNIALKSAKVFRKAPLAVAQEFLPLIQKALSQSPIHSRITKLEIKPPGFINIFLSPAAWYQVIYDIFEQDKDYGKIDLGAGKRVQIEFVSANPTGPLSVAHARQAAVGDALGNILRAAGCNVTKEFYVNDEGNQINILGNSIRLRAFEILGKKIEFPEDHYQGEYIKDISQIYMDKHRVKSLVDLEAKNPDDIRQFGVDFLMDVIQKELTDFGVQFDVWSYQSKIATTKAIESVLELLKKKGHTKEEEGALWFKSTELGDDKDRVLKKSDGNYTYLTPDIIYHKTKFERGFDQVINMWGPDHHGYIPRLKASVAALGYDPDNLHVLIVQLATIYRQGQVVSMSTRRGQYISLREVMEEVGVDAARFFFMMRHTSAHLEFDLDLAKKQTAENPVYYIQYGHARVHSINKKAQEVGVTIKKQGLSLLKEPAEMDLIKTLGMFPDMLSFCYDQLDPYPLVSYLQDLATGFHKFYDQCKIIDDKDPVSGERLALCNATRIVIANGLRLLGISAPESM